MDSHSKGYEYEIFINDYLNNKDNIKISYLWKDIPEDILYTYGFINSLHDTRLNRKTDKINKLEDIGTDIIYINRDDECIIVQCKNYAEDNSITVKDLAGFFFIMSKHNYKIGEIYYTNKISYKILNEFNNCQRIKLIKKEMINNIIIHDKIKPYKYQKNIINIGKDYYKHNDSGIITMPCGTGKTLISCYIGMNYKIVIMITPLKQYAQQNIKRFNMYDNVRKSLLIDSDGIRNIDEINKFIKNNDKILLSATYKSCDIINQLNLINDVLIIFDEFHNFSYNNIYNDEDDIYKLINSDNIKKLFMSATPRIYELENNNDIEVNELFGDYIYKMSFNEAITNKYISDYELYLPIFNNEELDNEIKELNIQNDYLLKIQFLMEAIKMCGTLKMIIYMKCHEEIDIFIIEFNKINNNYYYYDVYINKITCNNSYSSRNKILDEFNNSNKISLLLSVHILDEAIDIPSCNSIYMTYVSSSKVKNIQRMSRAMRYRNKKIAKIFLFCNEMEECLDYISSIKEYDINFNTKINYLSISNKYTNIKERIIFNNENIEKNKIKILGIKLYKTESWHEKLELVKKYIDENNKRPSRHDKNIEIKKLAEWLSIQQNNYKNNKNIMKNLNIYNLWTEFINHENYKKYFDYNIKWNSHLNKLKKYINENKKLPSQYDKNIIFSKLYLWLNTQQYSYRYKKNIMKDDYIYNLWTNFLQDNNYKIYFENNKYFKDKKISWLSYFNNVKKYIQENNKKPSPTDNNKEIKNMNYWINNQQMYYKNIINIMKDTDIYNLWTDFINDNYYKKILENNNELWINNFNLLKKFINENNKLPSIYDNKILSSWLYSQKKNYIDKNNIMKDTYIYNLWKDFINHENYKIYFEYYKYNKNNLWIYYLNEIKKYINNNNKIPSQHDTDAEIKKLRKWLYKQQEKYSNPINIKKNDIYYKLWTDFINDDNYKIYFQDKKTLWINKLNEIKTYISKYDKLPLDNNILNNWINTQKKIIIKKYT